MTLEGGQTVTKEDVYSRDVPLRVLAANDYCTREIWGGGNPGTREFWGQI